jgi:hypothetical protein
VQPGIPITNRIWKVLGILALGAALTVAIWNGSHYG